MRGAAILCVACIPILAGCGSGKFFIPVCQAQNNCNSSGGGGSTTYSSYAYVANATTQNLALFPLPTAAFTSISGTTSVLGATPTALAATPGGTFLYVATSQGSVVVYSIGAKGALTLGNGGNAVTTTLNPVWMTVDPSGQWLFLLSSSTTALLEYQINTSTGVLTAANGNGTALGSGTPAQVYVTPDNQAVYVAHGTGGVAAFAFDSTTGVLSNQTNLAPKSSNGVSDNALGGDGNSAFLIVGEAGTGLRVFNIGNAGALTEVSGSPFATQLGPRSIVVDPTNTYVYVANSAASVITGYTLGTSGALTPLSSSPFTAGTTPVSMSLDSTGTYLLVVSQGGTPDLRIFSFDATTPGKLDSVASSATGTDPTGPVSLAVVP